MPIPCYLALTAAEFANTDPLPEKIAWMACHYSCYGTGLSNLPTQLPEGSMIIVNDRTPPDRHDPQRILEQLRSLTETLKPDSILLDFQRAGFSLNQQLPQILVEGLPCPVGVTAEYAQHTNCAVFLEPPPLHMPLSDYIAPWEGREIWLEAVSETKCYRITAEGCQIQSQEDCPLPEPVLTEESLFFRYHLELADDAAVFTLHRDKKSLDALLENATGITRAIGLYQQLRK